jgi:RNA polymerase sigma factor (TIGR02999 family)
MRTATGHVAELLAELQKGDAASASRIFPIVYKELRRLAAHYMRGERSGQTIQPTELVHEAYLRLVGQERIQWQGRTHFFAMAATSMRRILVERARRKLAEKHGGGGEKVQLEEALVFSLEKSKDMVALDDALKRLEKISPRQSRVVELRFFGGLEMKEIAKIEAVSLRTVKEDWSLARAWLHHEIARGQIVLANEN